VILPLIACAIAGILTYGVAVRAGFAAVVAGIFAGLIVLLWVTFFIGRQAAHVSMHRHYWASGCDDLSHPVPGTDNAPHR
jgi:uncharacterized membrane protein YdjX (TVP38/TMEM64 family)